MISSTKLYFLFYVYSYVDKSFCLKTEAITEYCTLETFSPSCSADEVTVLQHAVYGRMNIGKCIKSDFYLGCSVNVLDVVDKICSGKHGCSVPIPNTPMSEKLDCLPDPSLSAYLEAAYNCVKVHIPRSNTCHAPEKISLDKDTLRISSEVSKDTSCGLLGSPWILEAEPGQVITISMTDFSWTNQSNPSRSQCVTNYGYILDMGGDNVVSICGRGDDRDKHVYTSAWHGVQVVLDSNAVNKHKFLLHFQASGCPEYKPPSHSWIQKENDSLVIGCVFSEKQWKLRCVDNKWLGVVGNCTPGSSSTLAVTEVQRPAVKVVDTSEQQIPQVSNNHVIVFTIGCLTLLLCCVVIIVGVYYIKRYNVKIKKYSSPNFNTVATYHDGKTTLSKVRKTYRPPVNRAHSLVGTMCPPAYTFSLPNKEVEQPGPQVPPRNSTNRNGQLKNGGNQDDNTVYENVGGDSESVQYYILENPADAN